MGDALRFLEALYGGKSDDTFILIWTLRDKVSSWHRTAEAASAQVQSIAKADVYVGVALSPKDYGRGKRCPSEDAAGIVGLWLDVDVLGDGHKKTNLPATIEEAEELIAAMGAEPTLVVNSGGGLQAWWLFNEPWMFEGPDDRSDAAVAAARWSQTFRARSKERGWDADSTGDLARVFRVPGTKNNKAEKPRAVKLIREGGPRYEPDDLLDLCVDAKLGQQDTKVAMASVGVLVVTAELNPPFDKFEALAAAEPRFRKSWERTRRDVQDTSPSGWDMSLATFAAAGGWTDQEILSLMVAARRKHGDDLKLHREDHYRRTIAKARAPLALSHAAESFEDIMADIAEGTTTPEEAAPVLITDVSTMLGVQVTRFVKYMSEPAIYRMETPKGSVNLGGIESVTAQFKFRNSVAEATREWPRAFAKGEWDRIVKGILLVFEEEELGEEATEAGQARAWLRAYLRACPSPQAVVGHLDQDRYPFMMGGSLHVVGPAFHTWLRRSQGVNVSSKALGAKLRAAGATAKTVACVKEDGTRSTVSAWIVQPSL